MHFRTDEEDARERASCPCGSPLSGPPPWQWCPACADRREAECRREEAIHLTEMAWWATQEAIPRWPWARYDNAAWLGRAPAARHAAIRAWKPGRGLLLLGPTGAGKSSALVARLHELARLGRAEAQRGVCVLEPVMWTTEAALVAASRAHPLGRGDPPLVRDAMVARSLIVDEVGPAGAKDLMMAVADARYSRGLRTVVTTGMTLQHLSGVYGDAFVRRITTGGMVVDLHEVEA